MRGRNGLALYLTDPGLGDSSGASIYLAMNEGTFAQSFVVPPGAWTVIASSDPVAILQPDGTLPLCDRSLAVMECQV